MAVEDVKYTVVENTHQHRFGRSMVHEGDLFKTNGPNGCVTFQLEKAVVLESIELTNFSSAFVEVVALESLDSPPKVLVPVRSVVSPSSLKKHKKCDRSLKFCVDQFSKVHRRDAHSHIQIICSQPFNASIDYYGFRQVRIRGHESPAAVINSSPVESSISHGNARTDAQKVTMGKFSFETKLSTSNVLDSYDMNYKKQLMNLYERKPRTIKAEEEEENGAGHRVKAEEAAPSTSKKRKLTENSQIQPEQKRSKLDTTDASTSRAKNGNDSDAKCATQTLADVVFVLSGFENPQRTQLRDIGVSMGARYSPKWDSNCTHLVCAVRGTPKYNEVRKQKNGRIVSEKWILECREQNKRLKWQNFPVSDSNKTSDSEAHRPVKTENSKKQIHDIDGGTKVSPTEVKDDIKTNGKQRDDNNNSAKHRKRAVKEELSEMRNQNDGPVRACSTSSRDAPDRSHFSNKPTTSFTTGDSDSDVIYELDTDDEQ